MVALLVTSLDFWTAMYLGSQSLLFYYIAPTISPSNYNTLPAFLQLSIITSYSIHSANLSLKLSYPKAFICFLASI